MYLNNTYNKLQSNELMNFIIYRKPTIRIEFFTDVNQII